MVNLGDFAGTIGGYGVACDVAKSLDILIRLYFCTYLEQAPVSQPAKY